MGLLDHPHVEAAAAKQFGARIWRLWLLKKTAVLWTPLLLIIAVSWGVSRVKSGEWTLPHTPTWVFWAAGLIVFAWLLLRRRNKPYRSRYK